MSPILALLALVLTGCTTFKAGVVPGTTATAGSAVTVYVIRRSWHTDIGLATGDLHPPLAAMTPALPGARYVLFGFGDRQYLMQRGGSATGMVGAVWPGAGLVLATGLSATPEAAFSAADVVRLTLSRAQADRLQEFIWRTLQSRDGDIAPLAQGPYPGSVYFASGTRYSGLHTCNTWTAEGLQAAGLQVRSFAVEFSSQVWRQARRVREQQLLATHAVTP